MGIHLIFVPSWLGVVFSIMKINGWVGVESRLSYLSIWINNVQMAIRAKFLKLFLATILNISAA
jgi:hypothetical protein